jgi:hypothetical protein
MRKHLLATTGRADDDDTIWGIDTEGGIAATINRSAAQTYHLIRNRAKNKIPVARHGHKTYSASRRRLRAWCAGEILQEP